MCGIVAAAARREVSEILLEGLRRLEYRGYDSAGVVVVDPDNEQADVLNLTADNLADPANFQSLKDSFLGAVVREANPPKR